MAASGGAWKQGVFVAKKPDISKGSEGVIGNYEYFRDEKGELYRASTTYPINSAGYRSGAIWEAPKHMADEFLRMIRQPRQQVLFD